MLENEQLQQGFPERQAVLAKILPTTHYLYFIKVSCESSWRNKQLPLHPENMVRDVEVVALARSSIYFWWKLPKYPGKGLIKDTI